MAARKRALSLTDDWRQKIQASMLINRLTDFVNGQVEMAPHQVTAALGLLRKVAPDLAATENKTEVTHNYVSRIPSASKTMDEWQSQHADKLNPTTTLQ